MIILNFKLYPQTFEDGALSLVKVCQEVSEKFKVPIIPAVSALDLHRLSSVSSLDFFLQKTDQYLEGKHTGWTSALQASYLGAKGALLNHSEHPLPSGTVKAVLKSNKSIPNFKTVLCIKSLGQALSWALSLKPDYLAYEPKNLIARKDVSVSSEKPKIIKKLVNLSKNVPILVGAGIHSKQDVVTALSLGAKGVVLSSDVVASKDPKKELTDLASAFV